MTTYYLVHPRTLEGPQNLNLSFHFLKTGRSALCSQLESCTVEASRLNIVVFPQPFCRTTEPVCGHNGETYSSVCVAYSDRVAVDYSGRCQAVGVLSEHSAVTECAAVKCPSLSALGCKPIIPPGELRSSGPAWKMSL